MSHQATPSNNRRGFLTGRALREEIERAGDRIADEIVGTEAELAEPSARETIRLSTRAMACEFSAIMNPGPANQVMFASDALDMVHALEAQMTAYRDDSELSELNQRAAAEPVTVEPGLFQLLLQTRALYEETQGAFDATSGPLIALWRRCRDAGRLPTQTEIDECRGRTGMNHLTFDEQHFSVRFQTQGVELNLGGIGKGYALDRAGEFLTEQQVENWLFHGGRSSILARGCHAAHAGWPVGIMNPLFTNRRLATVLLCDQAMSTSGSNIQYFRHGGRRYGHILDPRTGWPAEPLLSATAFAPTAAEADALSTAFFVNGVEKTTRYCDNHSGIGAILIPQPRGGRRIEPIVCQVPKDRLFFTRNAEMDVCVPDGMSGNDTQG